MDENATNNKTAPEFDAFKELTEKLIAVSAKEIKAERAADDQGKPKSPKKSARKRKGS